MLQALMKINGHKAEGIMAAIVGQHVVRAGLDWIALIEVIILSLTLLLNELHKRRQKK